jgi:glycerol-3-phosphate cytidylyltransferase-like family protein
VGMRVVAVAGGFDTLRIGHTRHMQAAKALGDYLVVIVSTNKDLILKKGYYNMPFEERV